MKEEQFLIKTTGGPFDSETRVVPYSVIGWPPPVNLPGIFHGGAYIRQNFSDTPRALPGLMRSADYLWMEYNDVLHDSRHEAARDI